MASEQKIKDMLADMLVLQIEETGIELRGAAAELVEFAAARAQRLAEYLGDPDYDEMVAAVRDTVLLEAGIRATYEADAADRRIAELVHGGLRLLAAVLAK